MNRDLEPLLNDLLARWHRWAQAATRPDDSLLRDFDVLVGKVPPRLRAALVLQARNLSCGAQVWSSPRVEQATIAKARQRLHALLAPESARWFGPERVKLNERGNRIGESNPMAECSDHEVDLALQLREDGFSLAQIAEKMGVSKSCVQWWCNGGRRGQPVARVKEVG
jgi:hypothetical protein